MKIGFVTIWFSRGQSYVTQTFMKTLEEQHELFVFARTGSVFGEEKLSTNGEWDVPNLTTYPTYRINPVDLVDWVNKSKLDVVVFNEEYDFGLVEQIKAKTTAKAITYLDFYRDDWKPLMKMYDQVWCSSHRSYNLVKDLDTDVRYIGWGVDTELFKPAPLSNFKEKQRFTFFHNAGWLGIHYRKMTPLVIHVFNEACKYNLDITMLIHAQVGLDKLPPEIIEMVKTNDRLEYRVETVPHPGYYTEGKILIFVSKLEGLGLPLLEGLSCGLPAFVTDAPPMNEFVKDGYNGYTIPVAQVMQRSDNLVFPENIIDPNALFNRMLNFENRIEMGRAARQSILDNFTIGHLRERIGDALNELV